MCDPPHESLSALTEAKDAGMLSLIMRDIVGTSVSSKAILDIVNQVVKEVC